MEKDLDWVITDAGLQQINNSLLSCKSLKPLCDHLFDHPNASLLMRHFSDLYVLIAYHGSEKYLRPGEKSWKDILTDIQYNALENLNI